MHRTNMAAGIQTAINYIEEHITENIDNLQLAEQACISSFYFQRIFGALCGYTVAEYIRYRRLTLAGRELCESDAKVIDVALKYGYESPESFSRAFKQFHGISPSRAKAEPVSLKIFSRLSVKIVLRGGSMEKYRIERKKAFTVLEKVETHSVDDNVNKNTIPAFWERSWQDSTIKTLMGNMSQSNNLFGICYNSDYTDSKTFDYSIACMCAPDAKVPPGFRKNTIPARTWIVFDCIGKMPQAMQSAWHKMCSEIIPSSNYEPTYEFDIEAYSAGNMNCDDYKSELWIPIKEG